MKRRPTSLEIAELAIDTRISDIWSDVDALAVDGVLDVPCVALLIRSAYTQGYFDGQSEPREQLAVGTGYRKEVEAQEPPA